MKDERVMCTFTCSCGNTFKVLSDKESQNIEVCNECHPVYTGKQGLSKKTGRAEKFNKKYNLN